MVRSLSEDDGLRGDIGIAEGGREVVGARDPGLGLLANGRWVRLLKQPAGLSNILKNIKRFWCLTHSLYFLPQGVTA